MKVINPIEISESSIYSSTVVEDHPVWSSSTTYSVDDIVIYGTKKYKSLQNSNLNKIPSTVGSLWWIEIGPSNKFAMFDEQVNTQTIASSGTFTVVVSASNTDSIFFANVEAISINVTVRSGPTTSSPILYNYTLSSGLNEINNWLKYFTYDPFFRPSQYYLTNLPSSSGNYVFITFNNGSNPAKCGVCVIGSIFELGKTEYGASAGIIDYSRKETNEQGETTFVRRNFSKRLETRLFVKRENVSRTQKILYEIRSKPVVWLASDDLAYQEPLVVYGFYRDFSTEIAYPTVSYCNIQIEGLI